jgi:hypothetical protein
MLMRATLLLCICVALSCAFSVDRRKFWSQAAGGAGSLCLLSSQPALAASQEAADKAKIVKGYQRLTYLLENWEKETTICGRGDNPYIGCERTPMKVMDVRAYV